MEDWVEGGPDDCCQCMWPSSQCSCRSGPTDTVGSQTADPSPCRADWHRMVASLKIWLHSELVKIRRYSQCVKKWDKLPPTWVYRCFSLQRVRTSCSHGISSENCSLWLAAHQRNLSIRMLASAVIPATAQAMCLKPTVSWRTRAQNTCTSCTIHSVLYSYFGQRNVSVYGLSAYTRPND